MESDFDFTRFRLEVSAATKRAFADLQHNHADETIYAFALYSDDGAMTVCPAANTEEALKRQLNRGGTIAGEQPAYWRWGTGEWAYEFEGAQYFNAANEMLRTAVLELPEDTFFKFRQSVFETIIAALRDLENDAFFGAGSKRDALTIFFTISDSEEAEKWENQSARDLNPPAAYERFGKA